MLDITPEHLARQEQIGWIGYAPVYHIETTGGYSVIAVFRNGHLEPLGRGPHPAVSRSIARKREPTIVYTQLEKTEVRVDEQSATYRNAERETADLRRYMGYKG